MENKTLYAKLLDVSKEIDPISKDSKNPFFKSYYFDINKLIEVVRPVLSKNGLVLLQPISEGKQYSIIIDADSGEQIESSLELPKIQDAQKLGSAITYFRRYTLQSLLGLQAEDDDGNKAAKPEPPKKPKLAEDKFKSALEKFNKTQLQTVLDTYDLTEIQSKAIKLTKVFTDGSK